MTVIVCLDSRGGMLFNNRRQTLDYEIVDMIVNAAKDKLYISPFSEKYFSGKVSKVVDDPLKDAPDDAYVFIEDRQVTAALDRIDKLLIYRWAAHYPTDTVFELDPIKAGFRLVGKIKFSTKVHPDTIKEIYKK